jgi:hypothetical protein
VSQKKTEDNWNTDDDVAYILDVFYQEATVELGIQQKESTTRIGGTIDMINISIKQGMTQALRQRVRPF